MGKVLVIGAGGVSTVAVKKLAMNADVFDEIMVASRTKSKCDKIAADIQNVTVQTSQVDADNVDELVALFEAFKPELVVNLALPYQDLHIMDACLRYGVSYLDTANYEPLDEAKYQYSWQWAYKKRFEEAGLTAILGCGFDPGVTGVYTAYAAKHHFDEIQYLDIVDCNAGDHHKAFATNFNPEINIREITQRGKYFEDGEWKETDPLSVHKPLNYPNIGMASIKPILYNGVEIVPIQFLKAVLPNPGDLGENYTGETSIGCRIRGLKDGKELTYYVYNNCSHHAAYVETGAQGVSYTTGVPAMIGAKLFMQGIWRKPGVWNVEEFDPDPFMKELNEQGLPWHELFNVDLEL